jgi:hypothetical protein
VLCRIFITRRELTQFIRETGPENHTTLVDQPHNKGSRGPERLRSADHTTKHSGGLDWDLNTHRSTHRSDWDIDTINSNNCKGSVREGTSIRVSTTLIRRRHEPPDTAKKQTLSSPPLKGETTAYSLLFFSFFFQHNHGRATTTQQATLKTPSSPKGNTPTTAGQARSQETSPPRRM